MMTKSEALKFARAKWPKAQVAENKLAPKPAQRQANIARRTAIRARLEEIRLEHVKIGKHWEKLMKAARFVVDVNGDVPSIDELRAALEPAERFAALSDEARNLTAERDSLDCHNQRWRVGVVLNGPIQMFDVKAEADSLEELVAKIVSSTR